MHFRYHDHYFLFNSFLGNFTLFAVFVPRLLLNTRLMYGIIERLVSRIPDKIKFVVMPLYRWMETWELTETLLVATPFRDELVLGLMLEILNKRWRKLDLISMMEELQRSLYEKYPDVYRIFREHGISMITDHLTSLPRFRNEEDITD